MLNVRPPQTVSMLTQDGVRLDADVYYPDADGEFPVLLMRQPYGRAIASTVVYAHPRWYAAHGYIVVIQDVRGRGSSEGHFDLFAHEVADGGETVTWAATLPGCDGQVGMYGFSYQGMTQLFAAATHPPALKILCPAMLAYDLYADIAYEGGAFSLQNNLSWAIQLAAETARLREDETAFQALFAASRNLPLYDAIPARPNILQKLAADSFYHDWLDHPDPGEYWEKLSPQIYMAEVDLPMLHIGGWFDSFLRGTLRCYHDMAARCTWPQHLVIGPWAHLPWGRKLGVMDYGREAVSDLDRLQIRWFDQFLKGIDTGLLTEPPVRLFEMGSNQWRSLPAWPAPPLQSRFLSSNGLAAIDERNGHLCDVAPVNIQADVFVHDPWRPVPAVGGHAAFPAGSCDRTAVDSRSDVVTYTSAPLETALTVAGNPTAEIWCTADAVSFDLSVVLSIVDANGRVSNITQGHRRVQPGDSTAPVRIDLQPTCIQVNPGESLRLSISAACFPAYPVNPGTGTPPGQARLIESRVITVTLFSGGDCPSQIRLPILQL